MLFLHLYGFATVWFFELIFLYYTSLSYATSGHATLLQLCNYSIPRLFTNIASPLSQKVLVLMLTRVFGAGLYLLHQAINPIIILGQPEIQ